METILIIGKGAIFVLPLLVFGLVGYREWKKHYDGGLISYYYRGATGKKLEQDNTITVLTKAAILIGWFVIMSHLLI